MRRRRLPREEVFAYAVLGALAGYFVQNLFYFDTPATMLQLAVLMAWVASQERAVEDQQRRLVDQDAAQQPVDLNGLKSGALRWRATAGLWGRGAVSVTIVMLVGLSLYHLHYQPYQSAKTIMEALESQGTAPMAARLILAEKSFDTFPPLANLPRAVLFRQVAAEWDELSEEERIQAARLTIQETAKGLKTEPDNFHLMVGAVMVLRNDPENLPMVESLLERILEVAPERIQTHVLLAEHEFLQGNHQEANRIADEYVARVPGTESYFQQVVGKDQQNRLTPY